MKFRSVLLFALLLGQDGRFQAPSLPAGQYDISIEAAGFKRKERHEWSGSVESRLTKYFNTAVYSQPAP
jgi:hypothetical protein